MLARPRWLAVRSAALAAGVALGLSALNGVAAPGVQAEEAPAPVSVVPGQFALTGAGWGHGVGMSQWGAFGMARAGYDAAGIVTHYYQGTSVLPVQDDMDIRVALLHQTRRAVMRSEPLDPSGGAIEVAVGPNVVVGGPLDEFSFTVRGAEVGVERTAGGQTVDLGVAPTVTVRWSGTRAPGAAAGGPTLLNVVRNRSSLDSSGHRYRYGHVEVVPVSTKNGVRLNVINSVRVHDEYLYGIAEVPSSWPEAAMQAQVLAARSYAVSKIDSGVRQSCSCHVDDGGGPFADQTFTGWGKPSGPMGERWVAAVNATHASETTGNAILHEGKAIRAFYHSSSGGATQSVQDVWGGTLPYVVSVPDPWMNVPENSNAAWSVTVPQSTMAAAFGVPAISSVVVTARDASGAVRSVTGTTPEGAAISLSGPKWATALRLKSRYVNAIDGNPGVPLPQVGAPAPPAAGPPADVPADVSADVPAAAAPTVVQRTVSLLSPAAVTVRKGKGYRVVGVVRPGKAKLKVWRQKLVGTEWRTVAKDRTNAKGRYRFVVRDAGRKATGTFRVLVVKKKEVVGVSPDFTVTLR